MAKTVLITGANRGIGLGLTTEFLKNGWSVIAAARNPDGARDLWELETYHAKMLKLIRLDVSDIESIQNLSNILQNVPLDLLINNAGVLPDGAADINTVTASQLQQAFQINTIAPLLVTQACLKNLRLAKPGVVATITSRMGSIADNTSGGYYAYRSSKSAVNMVMTSLAHDVKEVIPVLIHPGWVQTDMGGRSAPTSVHESQSGIYRVLTSIDETKRGAFLDFRGDPLPW